MGYLDSVKRYIGKENYNFSRTDVSVYNFHPQLLLCLGLNGIRKNRNKSNIRVVWPLMTVSFGTIGIVFQIMFITHYLTIRDYSLAAECMCYCLTVTSVPMVYTSMAMNSTNLLQIMENMNNDFSMICNNKTEYREFFLKGQLLIWKLCSSWFCLIAMLLSTMAVLPLISLTQSTLFGTPHEDTVRPLLFPMWLPNDDPYKTPNYEIFLVAQILILISFLPTFYVFVYIFFHIILHYCIIIDVIIMEFDVLFDDLEQNVVSLPPHHPRRVAVQRELNKRIGSIVKMHQSVLETIKAVSSVYGFPLMFQVSFTAPILCLSAYQIAEKLENGTLNILFALIFFVAVVQLWISCYLGTMLTNKAFAVGDACWNSKWHATSLGQLVRSDIIIILWRTQQEVTIKFIGLPSVGLQTFSLIITKAYSYFNMLRQYA